MIQALTTPQVALGASHPALRVLPVLGFVSLGLIFLFGLCLFFVVRRFRRQRDRIETALKERSKSTHVDSWAESARRMPLESGGPIEPRPDDDLPDFGGRS